MRKTTVYSLYMSWGSIYLRSHEGYLIEQGCAVYRVERGRWRVIDMDTGLAICDGSSLIKAIDRFRADYLDMLIVYRAKHAEDYKAKVERMNTLYEDYIKGTC